MGTPMGMPRAPRSDDARDGGGTEHASVRFFDLLRMAVDDLLTRPMRTLLTVFTFAISMVIAVVLIATGEGVETTVTRMLRDLGEGQVAATPGRTTGIGGVRRSGREVRIRYAELPSIREALPSFTGIAAYYDLRGGGASSRKYSIPWSPTRAVAPGYREIRNVPLLEGRWFSPQEESDGEWVTVLNSGLRSMLFRDGPAVGQWIEWRGRRMTVVGVVQDEAAFPYIFLIPYETVTQMTDARHVTGIVARPRPDAAWETAIEELRRAVAGLGGFDWRDESALEIETNHEFTRQVRTLTTALEALVITIAAVSLFLGASSVANMLAMGVSEKTREIGLRRALGARARDVFLQVFLESSLVVACGALAGMAAGWLVCRTVGEVRMTTQYTARIDLDPGAAAVVLVILAAVGIVCAMLPARRAASLAPVEALRWE